MAAEFGCIDFMFLGPPLPGRWIRYCVAVLIVPTGQEIATMEMSPLKPLSIINCYLPFNTELDEHLKSSNFIVIAHLLVPELK